MSLLAVWAWQSCVLCLGLSLCKITKLMQLHKAVVSILEDLLSVQSCPWYMISELSCYYTDLCVCPSLLSVSCFESETLS